MAKPIKIEIVGDAKKFVGSLQEAGAGIDGFSAKTAAAFAAGGLAVVGFGAAVGKELYNVGEEFDKAYDHLRVGTGATGADLENLKDEFRGIAENVPASFDEISTAMVDLQQKLGLTSADLMNVATDVLNLSRLTGTDLKTNIESVSMAFKNWGVVQEDQAPTLDMLYRAYQATGLSVSSLSDTLAKNGATFRGLGYNMTEATALVGAFTQAGVDADAATAGLRKGLTNLAKAGEDPKAAFKRIVDEIAKLGPNNIKGTQEAIALFGKKAGIEMANAINTGAFSIDAMYNVIANGKDTIQGASDDTEDFAEKWRKFSNRLKVDVEPLASRVFTAVGAAMDHMGPIIDSVEAKWQSWQPTLQGIAETWLPRLSAALQFVGGWFQKGIEFATTHKTVMDGLKWTLEGVAAAFAGIAVVVAAMSVAAVAAIGAITIAVGALVGWVGKLVTHFDTIKKDFEGGLGAIGNFFTGGHAAGGTMMAGGWTMVGERGPEPVWLPQGARVMPSWSGAGGGGGDTYNIIGSNVSAPELAREIAWTRRRGDGR